MQDLKQFNALRANDVIGQPLRNYHEDYLGNIYDILLSPSTGNIDYIILSVNGMLQIGIKYILVPWKAINYDIISHSYLLNKNKEELLKDAPTLSKDNWVDKLDEAREKIIHQYYNLTPDLEIVKEKKDQIKKAINRQLSPFKNSTAHTMNEIKSLTQSYQEELVTRIHSHPWKAIGIAAGLGAALSTLVNHKRILKR